MSTIPPVSSISAGPLPTVAPLATATEPSGVSFSNLLSGLRAMETKVARADQLVQRFAVDDSVPVHQVTYALEEARLSIELAMQVRTRLVEAYRDLMNMQL